MKTNIHLLPYRAHFFLEWEMFQTIVVEKIKTHFVFSNFFPKIVSFMGKCRMNIVERGWPQRQYGACALHAGYLRLQIHTLMLCNTHCFFTTTMVTRKRLNVTLHAHCLSCLSCFQWIQRVYLEIGDECLISNLSLLIIHYYFSDTLIFI
jgi:hypothetical protein